MAKIKAFLGPILHIMDTNWNKQSQNPAYAGVLKTALTFGNQKELCSKFNIFKM